MPEAEYLLTEATEILEKIDSLENNLTRLRSLETGKIDDRHLEHKQIYFSEYISLSAR